MGGPIESMHGLIFTGGVIVGLCISIFTVRMYYAETLKRNIEAFRLEGQKIIDGYKKRMEELQKELDELKGE
jgi:uncharacterized membrane protein (DUF106 family)